MHRLRLLQLSLVVVSILMAAVASSDAPTVSVKSVEVPGDVDAHAVVGRSTVLRPIVYLHGMCGDPREDLEGWGGAAQAYGGIVALKGDASCGEKASRTQWTTDVRDIDARISAALDAARASGALPRGARTDDVTLVGMSMGAARAESLAAAYPGRYAHVILIASPHAPAAKSFENARAVAMLAGELEDQQNMREGARVLAAVGKPAQFWALPGARHGAYGPEGDRVLGEALAFVGSW